MALIIGVAVGGPRNKVKLSAASTWDGRIVKSKIANTSGGLHYYPGHYVLWRDNIKTLWIWQHDLH